MQGVQLKYGLAADHRHKAWANQKMNKTPNGRFQFCENKAAAISRNPVHAGAACDLQACRSAVRARTLLLSPLLGMALPSPSLCTLLTSLSPKSQFLISKSQIPKLINRIWKAVNKIRWTAVSRTWGSPTWLLVPIDCRSSDDCFHAWALFQQIVPETWLEEYWQ